MKFRCRHCNAAYTVDDRKIPEGGIQSRCKQCGALIRIEKQPPRQGAPATSAKKDWKQGSSKAASFTRVFDFRKKTLAIAAVLLVLAVSIRIDPVRLLVFDSHIFNAMDRSAAATIDENLKRATITFVAARGINAVISVIQETHVQVQPAGVGVSVALGEAFDPINDLVERFSWVMLLSLISLGIMKILIQVSAWLSIDILLFSGLLSAVIGLLLVERHRTLFVSVAKKAILAAVVVKLAVPVAAHLNDSIYRSVLHAEYTAAKSELELKQQELEKINEDIDHGIEAEPAAGWMGKIKGAKESVAKMVDLKGRVDRIRDVVSNIADTLVRLSVVFLLNTVLLPIAFLWLFVQFCRIIFGSRFASSFEKKMKEKIFVPKTEGTAAASASSRKS